LLRAAWSCYPSVDGGNVTPVRRDANGLVECMSNDANNCYWGSPSQCEAWANTAGSFTLRPLKCSRASMASGAGWCYYGAALLGLATGEHRFS
jgi:hypothetical protein